MTRNRCLGWADGDPVTCAKQDGTVIAIGKVVIRKSHAGKWYCKVQIQTVGTGLGQIGEWVWPEGWVIGQGPKAGICLDCGQEFRTAEEKPSGFCLPCDRRETASWAAASDIRRPGAYLHGARSDAPRTVNTATAEQIAADLRARQDETPF